MSWSGEGYTASTRSINPNWDVPVQQFHEVLELLGIITNLKWHSQPNYTGIWTTGEKDKVIDACTLLVNEGINCDLDVRSDAVQDDYRILIGSVHGIIDQSSDLVTKYRGKIVGMKTGIL